MTLNEIIKVLNGKTSLNSDEIVKSIKIDSRLIETGDIFIAIKGNNYNGEDFIEEAIGRGAIACITESNLNDKCIIVDSTIDSLFCLGNYIRNMYNIPLIAITGSNGKTTTKELLYDVLSIKYKVLKNDESKNNIIGVSNTLFKLDNSYDIILMEFGTNHIGEISKLRDMCNPNLALITNIGTNHIGYFKNKKNIFKEKISIIEDKKDLIVNGDDKYLNRLKCYKCGIGKNNNLKAYNIKTYIDHITFNIYLDKEYEVVFNNPGIHFVNNILLVIEVGLRYNVDILDIIKCISEYKLIHMRMNLEYINDNILINDCYNSSYESVVAGINYLMNIKEEKLLLIGDILELGRYSKYIHKKINKQIKKLNNYKVITVGKYSKYIDGRHYNNVDELIKYNNIYCKYIYVKGSRKINLDKYIEYIKKKEH